MNNKSDISLETRLVSKSFGNVHALKDVSFLCRSGEVHGLVGENGAGKSTLMKILAGECQPDSGAIIIRGEPVNFKNPRHSKEKGISLIHQEFFLVPYLNVAENILLGSEPKNRLGLISNRLLYQRSRDILNELKIELDLHREITQLSIAQRQLVEIAKSLQSNPQILIMDEPTAALERNEIDNLFSLIRRLRDQGRTVIFISHRLEEVFEITGNITVLRNGRLANTFDSAHVSKEELIEAIIGRRLEKFYPAKVSNIGKTILEVRDLSRNGKIAAININLREGEILGIAGLEGQGQHELMRAIFGADLCNDGTGEVCLKGKEVCLGHPKFTVRSGFGYVPADRQEEGLILHLSLAENISLPGLYKRTKLGFISKQKEEKAIQSQVDVLKIKAFSYDTPVKKLSGGNRQKVVLAKWLATDADVLVFDEPTRGVDIGTRAEIYSLMRDFANKGKAIIMTSRDLDEVIGLSDRIVIMYRGRIIEEYLAESCSKEHIMDVITRVPAEEARSCEYVVQD